MANSPELRMAEPTAVRRAKQVPLFAQNFNANALTIDVLTRCRIDRIDPHHQGRCSEGELRPRVFGREELMDFLRHPGTKSFHNRAGADLMVSAERDALDLKDAPIGEERL